MDEQTLTRGEFSNNPGNINYSITSAFLGQLGIEIVPFGKSYAPRFARFDCAHNGIRAIAKTLLTYINRDGANTLRKIINRWAPHEENNVIQYIYDVAKASGIEPDSVVVPNEDNLIMLTKAIIHHENGRVIYSDETITLAVKDALTPSNPYGVKI